MPTPNNLPVIPVEIIEKIFDNVNDDDIPTLSACAQTSSWFLRDIQKRIFASARLEAVLGRNPHGDRRIWLVDLHHNHKTAKFYAAVSRNPRLGTFVRRVYLRGISSTVERAEPETSSMIEVLPYLTQVEQFTFEKPDSGPIKFNQLSTPIQHALERTLERLKGSITKLDLSGLLVIPPSFICGYPHLSDLSFASISADIIPPSDTRNPHKAPIKLKRLRVCSSEPWTATQGGQLEGLIKLLKKHSAPLSLENLDTLIIDAPNADVQDTVYLLRSSPAQKLTSLGLCRTENDVYFPSTNNQFNLGSFHALTQLTLLMGPLFVWVAQGDTKTPLPWVTAVLKTLPFCHGLRLVLGCTIYSSVPLNHIKNHIPWGLLAGTLQSRRTEFEHILIRLTVICSPTDNASLCVHNIVNAMSTNHGVQELRGIANLTFEFEHARNVIVGG